MRDATGLPVVTEVVDARDVAVVAEHADMLQIGTRNMANFGLLQAVGDAGKPVLLKRGMTATIEEWLMAAEYIAQRGNLDVVLCERGIRTFEPATRNTLDISAVPVVQAISHLPIIVDPSHAAGRKDLVVPLSRAAIAVGADGVIVDVHPDPENALCDGPQALLGAELRAARPGGAAAAAGRRPGRRRRGSPRRPLNRRVGPSDRSSRAFLPVESSRRHKSRLGAPSVPTRRVVSAVSSEASTRAARSASARSTSRWVTSRRARGPTARDEHALLGGRGDHGRRRPTRRPPRCWSSTVGGVDAAAPRRAAGRARGPSASRSTWWSRA